MNEEIKELLHKLNNKAEHYILYDYEVNVLKDYITNLQEENERLTEILIEKDGQLKEMQIQKTDYTAVNILEMKLEDYKSRIDKAKEYLTSYEAISTIQGLDNIEQNKELDEKTIIVMTNRYLKFHDKLLNIIDKMNELEGVSDEI